MSRPSDHFTSKSLGESTHYEIFRCITFSHIPVSLCYLDPDHAVCGSRIETPAAEQSAVCAFVQRH